ncbi:MAG: alpha/beta hydrolase [Proteobacteria bacterium]|nr:alpha/beta hydrolase [Pseudomonadota bacterium]
MGYLERDGATIFFDHTNPETLPSPESPPVVTLINGHTRSSSDFKLMARQLVAANLSCLVLDNRGSGKSSFSRPFTFEEMEEDVVAVWDHLNISTSSVLGISMGGFIAQGLAAKHQKRLHHLMLVSTAPGPDWINSTDGSWSNREGQIEAKLEAYFASGFVERNRLLFESMVRQTRLAINDGRFAENSKMQRDALRGYQKCWRHSDILAKTMIVHGEEDRIVNIKASKELRQQIRGSELVSLPETGHLILAESPKKLYELALKWFRA